LPGIYLHIPFCRKACSYCDFFFVTQLKRKGPLVEAMAAEIALRSGFAGGGPATSLYLGGGTPSLLGEAELRLLYEAVNQFFPLLADAEITLEANPDDLSPDYLRMLAATGVRRLSIGIQSWREEDLRAFNRSHSREQGFAAYAAARAAGFANISLDLMYGLPGLGLGGWEENLRITLDLRPEHLSVYALTVEEKTALAHQLRQGRVQIPEDESYAAQFLLAHERLTAAGYEHYELSNYALPGFRARHNSSYWQGQPYLGIGPSAHSFDGERRSWNAAHLEHYLRALGEGRLPPGGEEALGSRERYHEHLMTGLRTAEGASLALLEELLPGFAARFAPQIAQLSGQGLLRQDQGRLRLSPQGWLLSDAIIADFFIG
jgi:oxygen-independent coproporphyrinogen-3 oxidase